MPMRRSAGSSSLANTMSGPHGQKPGNDLPSSHWSPSSHGSCDVTSLTIVYPSTDALSPITIPSSHSPFTFAVNERSQEMTEFPPMTDDDAFPYTSGRSGPGAFGLSGSR